jgi:methyl-accepting chemotaxis protein
VKKWDATGIGSSRGESNLNVDKINRNYKYWFNHYDYIKTGGKNMRWFYNWSTVRKIVVLMLVTVFFTGLVGYVGYYYTSHLKQSQTEMYEKHLLPVKWLNAARAQSRAAETLTVQLLLVDMDKQKEQRMLAEAKLRIEDVMKQIGDFEKISLDANVSKEMSTIKTMMVEYHRERAKALEISLSGKKQDGYAYFMKNAAGHIAHINAKMENMAETAATDAAKINAHSGMKAADSIKATMVITLAAMLISLGLGIFIARKISAPLIHMVGQAQQVAAGNLRERQAKVASRDEVGKLGEAFQTMTQNLRKLVQQVATSSQQVAESSQALTEGAEQSAQASTQIASAILGVSEGSARQIESVTAATLAVAQMSDGIKQTAEHANEVVCVAEKSASMAQDGGKAAEAAVRQMEKIENTVSQSAIAVSKLGERSKEIGQIVDTIASLASQTNLLALNAAIEAARAGEHGRGFSVVAEEVRQLADQSQEATKRIASLIQEVLAETEGAVRAMKLGTQEVRTGTEVVNLAGQTFSTISSLVHQVSAQVGAISETIRLMAGNSQQIVSSIREIEKISKENAAETQTVSAATEQQSASMEEVAAASHRLMQMAQSLEEATLVFRV